MVQRFDYLVIGSGIAGMSFALKVANEGKSVALICKAGQEEANTYFAQGGIASVTNLKVDNFEKHIEDTMIAGDWISDRAAVEKVVREAPAQIEALIRWGVNFDKKESGEFDLHKEQPKPYDRAWYTKPHWKADWRGSFPDFFSAGREDNLLEHPQKNQSGWSWQSMSKARIMLGGYRTNQRLPSAQFR